MVSMGKLLTTALYFLHLFMPVQVSVTFNLRRLGKTERLLVCHVCH